MVSRVLRKGDRGPEVANIQHLLRIEEDGIFGAGTDAAVRAFQALHGLEVDGLAGPDTLAALVHGADESAMCVEVDALAPWQTRRIDRARGTCKRGVRYKLGHGGWNPGRDLPGKPGPVDPADRGSGADCSGSFAFWFEVPRSQTIVAGLWGISTVSLVRDGLTPGGLFRQIPHPIPGCGAVYPDRGGKQGHVGLVTETTPHLRGIDCSSSRSDATGEAITERGFEFFRNAGAIWFVRNDDPEYGTAGNC